MNQASYVPKEGDIVCHVYEKGNPGFVVAVDVHPSIQRIFYTLHVKWLHAGLTSILAEDMVMDVQTYMNELQERGDDSAQRYQESIEILKERFSK